MKSRLLPLVACCAIGLLAACHAHREAAAPATAAVVPAASVELRAPRSGLLTAGQPAPSDWQAIAARGVTTVVNLRTPKEMEGRDEAAEVQAAGMHYVSIPVAGADGIDDANAARLREVLRVATGPVLVHCASGNRVGGLLALMAARGEGMPAEQAIALGRSAGMTSTEARVRAELDLPTANCVASAAGVRACP
jgi:uncharacterized protein (TIGR01244 family)